AVVPPLTFTVTLPLDCPHVDCVVVVLADSARGWVRITLSIIVHPLLSVIVTLYDPAVKLLADAFVPPPPVQLYVYPPAPPPAMTVAPPLLPPLQLMLVADEIFAVNGVGWVIVILAVALHPCAPDTVTVYVPAVRLYAVSIVAPFVQLYVYGSVPPPAVTTAWPVLFPLQATGVLEVMLAVNTAGWVIVTLALCEQPCASVTFIV